MIVFLTLATPVLTKANGEDADLGDQVALFDDDVEVTDKGWPRFSISGGMMYLAADGVLGVRFPNSAPITILNFDRVGLDENDASHWISLTWRSRSSRWGIWFANWRYDVNGLRTWDFDWTLPNGNTIPSGAQVSSEFSADWYIFEGTFSFLRTETLDAGLGFGFHAIDLETDLRALIEIGDGSTELVSGDIDSFAPLPNIMIYAYWRFLPRLSLIGRVGWFGLDYSNYSGQMTNAHLMVNYSVSPRFEIGAGYQFERLDMDIERNLYQEIYDIDFYGPMLFARFRF